MHPDEPFFLTILFAGGAIFCIVIPCVYYWSKVRTQEILASLKKSLLESGMNAQEIAMVVEAGLPNGEKSKSDSDAESKTELANQLRKPRVANPDVA